MEIVVVVGVVEVARVGIGVVVYKLVVVMVVVEVVVELGVEMGVGGGGGAGGGCCGGGAGVLVVVEMGMEVVK